MHFPKLSKGDIFKSACMQHMGPDRIYAPRAHLAKLPLPNHRNKLLSSGFFNNIFFVLILYDADPPEPARARRHADMQAAAQLVNKRASKTMPSAAMLVRLS